jgi:hypothetical protein
MAVICVIIAGIAGPIAAGIGGAVAGFGAIVDGVGEGVEGAEGAEGVIGAIVGAGDGAGTAVGTTESESLSCLCAFKGSRKNEFTGPRASRRNWKSSASAPRPQRAYEAILAKAKNRLRRPQEPWWFR